MKNAVSRFGKFLSGMVMPNIGAFIAWGFLTALFIEAGWFPNEKLASMVSPMLTYLLPILIAGQGGKMIGRRPRPCHRRHRRGGLHLRLGLHHADGCYGHGSSGRLGHQAIR